MPLDDRSVGADQPAGDDHLLTHGRWERLGLTLPGTQRVRLVRAWMQSRLVAASIFAIAGVTLGWSWGWSGGYVVAGLAGITAADAALGVHRATRTPTISAFIDITIVFAGMAIASAPDSAVGVPFTYLVVSSMLLLPARWAIPAMCYSSLGFVMVVRDWIDAPPLADSGRIVAVGIVTDVVFALAFVALVAIMLRIMNGEALRRSHDALMQRAIARASNGLLSGRSEDPLRDALAALAEATDATSVFLEMNVDDAELGLCSSMIVEVIADGSDADPDDLWQLVPWSSMSGREVLERGESHSLNVSELRGAEREIYDQSGTRSELDIPVFVDGRWWGILGFSDVYEERPWARRDVALLFTAAEMIGSYLERTEARRRIDQAVIDLDRQVIYHHALAECAEALQGSGPQTMDRALVALLEATDADYAFIDRNFDDPLLGLSTMVIHDAEKPGVADVESEREWMGGPYSELPTSLADLSAGRPSRVLTSQLVGREREIYEADGLKSELSLPIRVRGEWRGSIGFADYHDERTWTDAEVKILHTAARMIASHWAREESDVARNRMLVTQERRLRFETSIAECSRVLLMSGDSSAIDTALEHLMYATGTHDVFVDRNREDDDLGLVAEVVHEVVRPGFDDIVNAEIWTNEATGERRRTRMAYASLPTLRAALETGKPFVVIPEELPAGERDIYRLDGCKSELNIPIFAGGTWVGAIGFADYVEARAWDVDDIRLLQTVAEMIGSFWERNEARDRLQELVRSKDEFVAAVSHELRTPLTSVVGLSAELARYGAAMDEAEAAELLAIIADQSAEVAEIVDDLLVAARADIGTLVIDPQPILIRPALEAFRRTGAFSFFDEVEVDVGDIAVLADRTRLRQILRNLVVNASRYGGRRLALRASAEGDIATITVADDGPGVEDEFVEAIFEPYGRAHEAATQPASVGLGLSVSRNLARLMGGEVAYSRHGQWTEFVVTLPLAPATRLDEDRSGSDGSSPLESQSHQLASANTVVEQETADAT